MREIKFRGMVDGKWWYTTPFIDEPMDDNWQQFWCLVDPKTLGGFTGLHDKNGKEIYEGDVVSFVANYSSKPCGYMNGMVEFKDLQWLLTNKNGSYSIMEETDEFYAKSEIVANIYENPEFLNSLKI